MTQRILVAVDGRPAAQHALDWAARYAAQFDAELIVFQALDTPRPPIGTREHLAAMQKLADEIAATSTARVAEFAPGLAVSSRIERGGVVKLLEDASDDVDLIVVGTNAAGGGVAWALSGGTRAVRIAAASHCPVVVIPESDEVHERRGIVVGVDGSELSEHAIEFAATEAEKTGQPLIAITTWHLPTYMTHDFAVPAGMTDALRQGAEEALALSLAGVAERYGDLVIERRVEEGDPSHVLITAGRSAQLTVAGSRGRGGVRRLLLGSVSQSLLQHPPGPVAIVR